MLSEEVRKSEVRTVRADPYFPPSIYRGPVCEEARSPDRVGCRIGYGYKVSIGGRCVCRKKKFGSRTRGPGWVKNLKYLSGTGVCSRNKKLSGAGAPPMEKKKLSLERTTCLADKTNHPVERLSLNRSQCGSCSTKYDTSAGT